MFSNVFIDVLDIFRYVDAWPKRDGPSVDARKLWSTTQDIGRVDGTFHCHGEHSPSRNGQSYPQKFR